MSYRFNNDNSSLTKRICSINYVDINDLDVESFKVDYNQDLLIEFKDKILSLRDKHFFIVGDYDCDGICATTIMKKLLDDLGIKNNYYIPSRSKEGYGLNESIIDTAITHGFDVLLCVDNGVVAYDELSKAKDAGIITMVIDHHEYSDKPDVDAFLHPNLFPKEYDDMCAAGLCGLLSNSFRYDVLSTILAGLATLADMVKVFGYNRYLLKEMLKLIRENDIVQINYLLGNSDPTYDALSFNVIPKINAVSRLENKLNVNHLVKYLLNYNNEVNTYLSAIEAINKERKDLTKSMVSLASRLINHDDEVIIIKSDVFAEGLCGLIANRLMHEYLKPVIVFSEKDGELKGSGRSMKGSNLYEYLKKTDELFSAFGGHNQAVGLSMSSDRFDDLLSYVRNNHFEYDLDQKDVLVLNQNEIDDSLMNELENLKPFGSGFEEPLIGILNPDIEKKLMISRTYPKFVLSSNLEAISFDSSLSDVKFNMMIGKIKRDDNYHNRISMIIEDLIEF